MEPGEDTSWWISFFEFHALCYSYYLMLISEADVRTQKHYWFIHLVNIEQGIFRLASKL